MAGCVQHHSAFIYDRGGTRRVGELTNISEVRWNRIRDNVSEASIRLEGDACGENAELLYQARTHRHELVIFREDKRVWEGPLHRLPTQDGGYSEVFAKDPSLYLFFQPLTQRWSNAWENGVDHTTTVTDRIETIIEYELSHGRTMPHPGNGSPVAIPAWEALDPPINVLPHLDVRHFVNEARTAAVTLPYEMTVGMHLQNLARHSGIDFTTIGRRLLVWDVSRSLGEIRTLTSADFTTRVVVTEYGADHSQAAYVIGQDGSYGQSLNLENLDYYGPWTTMYTVYNEEGTSAPTDAELNSQAKRNLTGRSPAPIEVRVPDNSSIILSDTLSINDLVPGVHVPLRATINARPLSQMQRIDMVTVVETAEGEDVRITLTPATRPDSDVPA